jgi:plastocyanin
MRRFRLAILVLLLAVGCASGETTPGPNDGSSLDFHIKATIVVDDRGIEPGVTQARVGDAITVVNRGTKDHGLTSDTIDAGTLRPGESTTIFLTEKGTVELRDRADFSHTAHIDVSEAASS